MDLIVKYPHSVEYKKKLYVPGEPLPNDIPKKEVERLMIKGRIFCLCPPRRITLPT